MKVFLCLFSLVAFGAYLTLEETLVKDICRQGSGSTKCSKNNTYTWNSRLGTCRAVRLKSGPCGFFNIVERCNEICSEQQMSNDELDTFIMKYTV
ncbi:GL18811 [Drosophila persimilis]|uniref:GL18811 n=1 Tax=Drosophila persimilis TaxID=7234 RepID=B4G8L5_DROPE|nr:GL18811 [Drosophila persimilis]